MLQCPWRGEVNDEVSCRSLRELAHIVGIERGHDLEVSRLLERLGDERPHAAGPHQDDASQ